MKHILFLGTPAFAVPSLQALAKDERFEIVGVVTQPDKPVGRKGTLTAPPIKIAAQELGIKTIKQPQKLIDKDFRSWIEEIGPTCDAFIVVAYGKIFREWFLKLPKNGLINVHASLLPRWRGASPINAVIAAGDKKSGVCIMEIQEEMDAGGVYACAETEITDQDTAETLHDRLAQMGADLLPNTVFDILENDLKPIPQDDTKATYCKTLTREDGKIDWSKDAIEIECLLRAYTPWPGIWTEIDGKRVKIIRASISDQINDLAPSSIFKTESDEMAIACGNQTALIIESLQPEGKQAMDGRAFLNGRKSR